MAKKTTAKKTTKTTKTTNGDSKSTTNKKVRKTVALARKQKEEKPQIIEKPQPEKIVDKTPTSGKSVKIHKLTVFIVIGIVLLGLILYYGRGFFVAAVVNGQPVSRLALIKEAERQSGKQAMATLIQNALVEQEAKKQNVQISDKELENQIKTIEKNLSKQKQNLDQVLALQGMSRDDLNKLVKLDLLVTKIVEKEIKITDKDVADYIEKNKDILPKDQKEDALKKTVREQIKQEQLSGKVQAWLANLEKKSSIVKFVNY